MAKEVAMTTAVEHDEATQTMTGNEIIARCLRERGVEDIFYLMGGPMLDCELACGDEGIRMIDVRHEQAAVMMANAYSRLRRCPSVAMAASGPGVANMVTGVANAWADGAPVIAIGGAAPLSGNHRLVFQEVDQVAMFEPITVWSDRCLETRRLPEYIDLAFRAAFGSRPGPVYLDIPADVLYGRVPVDEVQPSSPTPRLRPQAGATEIAAAAELIARAEKPVVVFGSGVIWSEADEALRQFVESARIPFFATPQGRGVIPEDHPLCFLGARGTAFAECDLIVEVATRQSYVISHAEAPRWSDGAKLVQIDIDPTEIGRNRPADAGIVGDARSVLSQLVEVSDLGPDRHTDWVEELRQEHLAKLEKAEQRMSTDATPIHPLRLCKAVRDALPRDAVLVVDGQEILTFGRQSIPFYAPRSLNSGPFGTMGVGVPMALGAKAALPDAKVVVLHGDGSFGFNAMEIDTALRHGLPIVCVISNNGGWTADTPGWRKPGRHLGNTRYDLMFAPIGAHAEFVEDPGELAAAIDRAFESGLPAVVNVLTDPEARATGASFTKYET